jgi:hypothetical protein
MSFLLDEVNDPEVLVKLLNAAHIELGPDAFSVAGPMTLRHRLRTVNWKTGTSDIELPMIGGEQYRFASAECKRSIRRDDIKVNLIPVSPKIAARHSLAVIDFDDAMVLLKGFGDFIDKASEWAAAHAAEWIEKEKQEKLQESRELAEQSAFRNSSKAATIYGEEWGAF